MKLLLMERLGYIEAGKGGVVFKLVLLFQNFFLTGVVLGFELGEVLFKSGVAFKRIRYIKKGGYLKYLF